MRRFERLFLKILLAALPILALTIRFPDAWRAGTVVCVTYWFTASFFKLTWSFFPRRMLGFSMVFLLVFEGSLIWAWTGLTPYWLASVYLLGPLEFSERKQTVKTSQKQDRSKIISHRFSEIFLKGLIFMTLTAFLGGTQDFFSNRFAFSFFQSPAGALFLLGAAAVVCLDRPFLGEEPTKGK